MTETKQQELLKSYMISYIDSTPPYYYGKAVLQIDGYEITVKIEKADTPQKVLDELKIKITEAIDRFYNEK